MPYASRMRGGRTARPGSARAPTAQPGRRGRGGADDHRRQAPGGVRDLDEPVSIQHPLPVVGQRRPGDRTGPKRDAQPGAHTARLLPQLVRLSVADGTHPAPIGVDARDHERGLDPQQQLRIERPVSVRPGDPCRLRVDHLPRTVAWTPLSRRMARSAVGPSPKTRSMVVPRVRRSRPNGSPSKSLWAATPAAMRGCATWSSSTAGPAPRSTASRLMRHIAVPGPWKPSTGSGRRTSFTRRAARDQPEARPSGPRATRSDAPPQPGSEPDRGRAGV